MQVFGRAEEPVWDACGAERKLLLPEPREHWGGTASPTFRSDRRGAPVTSLDMEASEGGAESQNTCGQMNMEWRVRWLLSDGEWR